ncbi:MAG: hypothetical protein ACFCVH_11900 [Alphaproteobacteria bacterium]
MMRALRPARASYARSPAQVGVRRRPADPRTAPWIGPEAAAHCACGGGCPRCAQAPVRPAAEEAQPVVTFEPQPAGGESGAVESGTGAGTETAPAQPTKCQVKSFGMTFKQWNRQWPNGSGEYELRLPVDFSLELANGVSRSDCLIGQQKKGHVEYGRFRKLGRVNVPMRDRVVNTHSSWTSDAPRGQRYWWDGTTWHAGLGDWRFRWLGQGNERASFKDEPGFASPSTLGAVLSRGYGADGLGPHSFPIYWGGAGRNGHFRFRTFVEDAATGSMVRELGWGMLIDYADPANGAHYFYT